MKKRALPRTRGMERIFHTFYLMNDGIETFFTTDIKIGEMLQGYIFYQQKVTETKSVN